MTKEIEIITAVYNCFISKKSKDGIPVELRKAEVIGTVQDDPFDCWVESQLKKSLSKNYEVYHAGKLTTPDLIIRDKKSGVIIGIEIKKLIQRTDGKDSRGLTMDYNSCLPCGKAMIKVGKDTCIVPCYYLFALLNQDSTNILTLILLDGDFINYDFELHKEAKYSNYTEYNHGPYGEGSVRHRKMYTYPNPLNSSLSILFLHQVMILKKSSVGHSKISEHVTDEIVRTDKYGNSFYYALIDVNSNRETHHKFSVISDIFASCKTRQPKKRVAYIPEIPTL